MQCKHDDCLTCPYPVCVKEEKLKKEPKDRRAYYKAYYRAHREELINKSKERWRLRHDKEKQQAGHDHYGAA